jgi:hypothetical protein
MKRRLSDETVMVAGLAQDFPTQRPAKTQAVFS